MDEFFKTLLEKPWAAIGWSIGAIGWIIGLISGIVQLKGYREQKKLEKGYLNVLEQAKRDWEGKYTEDQIKELASELEKLQDKIRKDVPRQARQVLLEDQKVTLTDNILHLYGQYSQVSKELESSASSTSLPQNIKDAIEDVIQPSHLIRHREQQNVLAMITVAFVYFISVITGFIRGLIVTKDVYYHYEKVSMLAFTLFFLSVFIVEIYLLRRLLKDNIRVWAKKYTLLTPVFIIVSFFFLLFIVFLRSYHFNFITYYLFFRSQVYLTLFPLFIIPISLAPLMIYEGRAYLLSFLERP